MEVYGPVAVKAGLRSPARAARDNQAMSRPKKTQRMVEPMDVLDWDRERDRTVNIVPPIATRSLRYYGRPTHAACQEWPRIVGLEGNV